MKWYIPLGDGRTDKELYNEVLGRFQQLYREANEPEAVALYHSVDVDGHVRVLGLNAAAGERFPQLLEEFNWNEYSSSAPFRFIWIAGDGQLNNYPSSPR